MTRVESDVDFSASRRGQRVRHALRTIALAKGASTWLRATAEKDVIDHGCFSAAV